MTFNFNTKLFFSLFIGFVLFTIIGTLTHELGHFTAGKIVGFEGMRINYGATIGGTKPTLKEYFKIYNANKQAIEQNEPFEERERFEMLKKPLERDNFWFIFGGPIQTMTFGTFGFLILYFRKKKEQFKFIDWLYTFLSLFWLREIFNLLHGVLSGLVQNKGNYFGTHGDELYLSKALNLWEGTIPLLFGVLGLIISSIVIFSFIPKKIRFTFILAGLFGGIFGFWFWLSFLGPILMP